ncbi:MAG: 50S ribosomal protein L29 [Candidatus Gracilibacteria bacterium]|nr:50S ribosomal protein L29 [Candidatus Gracilibacteria bacterium]
MKELKDLKLLEISKLREMTTEELNVELTRASKNRFSLTMKYGVGELKQTHLIKALTKYVARINTIANTK